MNQIDNNFKLLKISEVAAILSVSVQSLRAAVKRKDWSYCPMPSPTKIGLRQSLRWFDYQVYDFANGNPIHYKTADKEKLPCVWGQYMN